MGLAKFWHPRCGRVFETEFFRDWPRCTECASEGFATFPLDKRIHLEYYLNTGYSESTSRISVENDISFILRTFGISKDSYEKMVNSHLASSESRFEESAKLLFSFKKKGGRNESTSAQSHQGEAPSIRREP